MLKQSGMCMNCLHCKLELAKRTCKIEGKKKNILKNWPPCLYIQLWNTGTWLAHTCAFHAFHITMVCVIFSFFVCSITCTCIILDKLNCWLIKKIVNLVMHIILFCDTCVYSFYTFSRFNMIMNYNEIDILNKYMYIMGNIIMYPCIVLFSIIRFLFVILST